MDIVTSQSVDEFFDVPKYATGSYDITHTDDGMLHYFWDIGCRSMLDVGCGPGGQVYLAKKIGYRALGIEVDPVFYRRDSVVLSDCCVSPVILPYPADLVWSNEVAEHIPPDCIRSYLLTLTKNASKVICMTANQEHGPLHLSVHPRDWWIDQMSALEWDIHPDNERLIYEYSTMEREFMRETGMIFVRSENA